MVVLRGRAPARAPREQGDFGRSGVRPKVSLARTHGVRLAVHFHLRYAGFIEGLDERHVHRVEVGAAGQGSGLRDVTHQGPSQDLLGHPDNYIEANPLSTPALIVPEWYFWPFYAILRAFTVDFILPAKLWGVLAMFASILLLFFLPWLDKSPVRSGSYRPTFKIFFVILIVDVLVLGWCGGLPAEEPYVMISQVATMYYFAHFLIILPILSLVERTLPLPNSISESVLHGEKAEAAPMGQTGGTAPTTTVA